MVILWSGGNVGAEEQVTLHLAVSNQSFAQPVAAFVVTIDGAEAWTVRQEESAAGGPVSSERPWSRHEIRLPAGDHIVTVRETESGAVSSHPLTLRAARWLAVTFWAPPPRIQFHESETPIATM